VRNTDPRPPDRDYLFARHAARRRRRRTGTFLVPLRGPMISVASFETAWSNSSNFSIVGIASPCS
jgi:hypothetical protein